MARVLQQLKAEPLLHAENIINKALVMVRMDEYHGLHNLEGQAFVDSLRACTKAEKILEHAFDYVEERIQTECTINII